jgi:hypothetical protein
MGHGEAVLQGWHWPSRPSVACVVESSRLLTCLEARELRPAGEGRTWLWDKIRFYRKYQTNRRIYSPKEVRWEDSLLNEPLDEMQAHVVCVSSGCISATLRHI